MIWIEIFCDRSQWLLSLFKKTYINKVLEKIWMDKYSKSLVPIHKGDKFSLMQCLNNDLEWKHMENIPYAFVVGSLMYAQTCMRPYISFADMYYRVAARPTKRQSRLDDKMQS